MSPSAFKVEPIARDRELTVSSILSDDEKKRIFVEFAKDQFKIADAENEKVAGRKVTSEKMVGGRRGAREEDVRLGEAIVYSWDIGSQAVAEIVDMLIKNSPRLTGAYADAHIIFADGIEVSRDTIPSVVDEIVIVNTTPYARKIEAGLSPQAPGGVYEATVAMARRRFGNSLRISFTFRSIANAGSSSLVSWARSKSLRKGRGRSKFERNTRNPAIVIRFK